MYYKGFYHLFYQYNPWGAVWGNLTWGHAVSEDLIHWLDIQPALENDHWYDNGGVWSGSVTIRPDGSPIIVYTGKYAF
jgi:sucrose-6-phosphate hydrolase SacC (GH32 family)